MSLTLYEASRDGRWCIVAESTRDRAASEAWICLAGTPTSVRRIGRPDADVKRGVVSPATRSVLVIGPQVILAALATAGEKDLHSRRPNAQVPRVAAWVVLREANLSLPRIAMFTGHDHTTVMYALKRAASLAGDPIYIAARAAAQATLAAATRGAA